MKLFVNLKTSLLILLLISTGTTFLSCYNADSTPQKVKQYVDLYSTQNGVYLFYASNKNKYLFLNQYSVEQGKEAYYFKDIRTKLKNKTMYIYFRQEATRNYINKKLNNRVLKRLKCYPKVDIIRIFRNGKETYFNAVGV